MLPQKNRKGILFCQFLGFAAITVGPADCRPNSKDPELIKNGFVLVPYEPVGHSHHPDVRISQSPLVSDCARLGLRKQVKHIHYTGKSRNHLGEMVERVFRTEEFDRHCNLTLSINYSTRDNKENYRCLFSRPHTKVIFADCGSMDANWQFMSEFREETTLDSEGRLQQKLTRTGVNSFSGQIDLEAGTETRTRMPANLLRRMSVYTYHHEGGRIRLHETLVVYDSGRVTGKLERNYTFDGNKLTVYPLYESPRPEQSQGTVYQLGHEAEIIAFENHPSYKGRHETRYIYDWRGNWTKLGTSRRNTAGSDGEVVWLTEREIEYY